jgi:hypothetical protein
MASRSFSAFTAGSVPFEDRVPLVNDRRTVHALGHQFRLEDPGGVLQLLRLLLLVHQEQRDTPMIAAFAGESLDDDFGAVGIDGDWRDRAVFQRQATRAATGMTLPDFPRVAGLLADEIFADLFDVLAPRRRQLKFLGFEIEGKRHAERRRDQGLILRRGLIGRAVLCGFTGQRTEGQFVAVEDFAVPSLFVVFGGW